MKSLNKSPPNKVSNQQNSFFPTVEFSRWIDIISKHLVVEKPDMFICDRK
jgi:hypothetical protein